MRYNIPSWNTLVRSTLTMPPSSSSFLLYAIFTVFDVAQTAFYLPALLP